MDSLQIIYSQQEAINFYKEAADSVRDMSLNYAMALISIVGIVLPLLNMYWQRNSINSSLDKVTSEMEKFKDSYKKEIAELQDKASKESQARVEIAIAYSEIFRLNADLKDQDIDDTKKSRIRSKMIASMNHFIRLGLVFNDKNIKTMSVRCISQYKLLPEGFDLNSTVQNKNGLKGHLDWLKSKETKRQDLYYDIVDYVRFLDNLGSKSRTGSSDQTIKDSN